MMVIEQFISLGKARQSMNLRPMASSTIAATPPVRHSRFYGRGRRAATKSPTGARGTKVAGVIPVWSQCSGRVSFPKDDIRGAPMIQVRHQPEFLAHAEALECWARARERAVLVLECEAEHALRWGLVDQALRLQSAASH